MSVQLVTNSSQPPANSATREIVGWALFLLILWLIAQFAFGRVLVYYILVLVIVVILLTQYHAIAGALSGASALRGNAA